MTEKDLYRQKMQAQLDAWKAELALLKARASGAGADAQLELKRQAEELDHHMQDAGARLGELGAAGEDAWDSVKKGLDAAWESVNAAWGNVKAKHGA
jgi:hypothetical protein